MIWSTRTFSRFTFVCLCLFLLYATSQLFKLLDKRGPIAESWTTFKHGSVADRYSKPQQVVPQVTPSYSPSFKTGETPSARSKVKVIAYSFYGGNNPRYTDGALANAKLAEQIFPGWEVWIYHDKSIPNTILKTLGSYKHVKLINKTGSKLKNPMLWRFLVASAPGVERYIIRDIDSRLSHREKAAVDEWIESGRKFHVMRDHPSHSNYPMSGGMWGGVEGAVDDIFSVMAAQHIGTQYIADMNFLNSKLWPLVSKDVLQHDSFSCDKYGGAKPFPTRREGWEHIGSVYINGKMRQGDVNILKQTPQPARCTIHTLRDNGHYKRTVIRSSEHESVNIVEKTLSGTTFDIASYNAIKSACKYLDKGVFWECRENASLEWVKANIPCTNFSFIARVSNAYVSDARVHQSVPGTIFTRSYIYQWQKYVRLVPEGPPERWKNPPKIHHFDCIGSILQAYPSATGHFPHEGLPRLLYLLRNIPAHCKIIVDINSFVQRYLLLLPDSYRNRILKWQGNGNIYHGDDVYAANESPFCEIPNPHNGGMSTYFHSNVLNLVRETYVVDSNMSIEESIESIQVVVIKRGGTARRYIEHASLVRMLKQIKSLDVKEFDASGTLRDHIQIFAPADVIIGPHGAGFSNLVFCKKNAFVFEIGWTSKAVMTMDNMYSRVAAAMNLKYRLLMATGAYNSPLSLSPHKVIQALKDESLIKS